MTAVDFAPDVSGSGSAAFCGALLESRERWRDLVTLTADFVFETDAAGRLVFVAPGTVLGWKAEALLGEPASRLLASPGTGLDPFRPAAAARNQRCWLNRADGAAACLSFDCAPLRPDADGAYTGARGIAHDVTAEHAREAETAAALRRGKVIEHVLWQMRQEVLAPRMMQAVLEGLMGAMGARGAAVVNLLKPPEDPDSIMHQAGGNVLAVLPAIYEMLEADTLDPISGREKLGHPVVACPNYTRFGERAGLALWRAPGGEAWDAEDRLLASAATAIVRVVLEHEAIQRELARQARTDPLTGLLNRRAFLGEIGRRLDRLDRDGQPGTLMFVDLDHLKDLNDQHGHDLGDEALVLTGQLLRNIVRPMDLVSRLGGDEFALWLDGSDQFTAAERAEMLRLEGPGAFARGLPALERPMTLSIGIAARLAGGGESVDNLMRRADLAIFEVKRTGRGHWRVAPDEFLP